jgi:hypothetical protein
VRLGAEHQTNTQPFLETHVDTIIQRLLPSFQALQTDSEITSETGSHTDFQFSSDNSLELNAADFLEAIRKRLPGSSSVKTMKDGRTEAKTDSLKQI